ncbi:MAG: PilT/PilU family type 4a pilus ATPase [Nitrospirae bacterium]|nr:PilT/PilU family type 4a pilus ATPase [Nitrospirota bacterium]
MPLNTINTLLKKAVQAGASDLHIKAGTPPIIRINGELSFMTGEKELTSADTMDIAFSLMTDAQKEVFKKRNDIDIAYSDPDHNRFRCNCFMQRGSAGIVFRVIPMEILKMEQLNLPAVLKKIALEPRGLIIVTGTTGSGKSTVLAAMIDHINSNRTCHIMTIEDPIEFYHKDKKSIVNQRETGNDTESFNKALRAALRQDPDVILVGEMRDFETIQTALVAAETGHLVLSTLHTVDAAETINRIISVFPPFQHKQVRLQLASILKAIISMRLLPRADGKGRVPAVEVLVATATIRSCVEDPEKTKSINDIIAQGFSQYGMQTFDQSLLALYKNGLISYEDALKSATNADDFALKVKGVQTTGESLEEKTDTSKDKKKTEIERFSR